MKRESGKKSTPSAEQEHTKSVDHKGTPNAKSGAGAAKPGSYSGGGRVPTRPWTAPVERAKQPRFQSGPATPHPVKFSGPGDASNVNADTHNGSILYEAQVRVIFWGKEWAASPSVPMTDVMSDVQSILNGPYFAGLEPYGINRVYLDRVLQLTDEDPPNNPFGKDDAGDRVKGLIDDGVFPEPAQDSFPAVYMVFLPSAVGGKALSIPDQGFHSNYLHFDGGDVDLSYVHVGWVGNNGTRQFMSFNFSHELVETVTDPDGSGWQVEPRSYFDWHEICDVCNSSFMLNGVAVASYWSNEDNSCIVTDSAFTTFTVQWIWRPSRIEWFGGIDEDGTAWQLPRQAVMNRIRNGDVFKVHGGTSGKDSTVGIYYLDPTHPYLATNTDGVPDDNLLALPQQRPT